MPLLDARADGGYAAATSRLAGSAVISSPNVKHRGAHSPLNCCFTRPSASGALLSYGAVVPGADVASAVSAATNPVANP